MELERTKSVEMTGLDSLSDIGTVTGAMTVSCEACLKSWDLSDEVSVKQWQQHQEFSATLAERLRTDVEKYLSLVGRSVRVVYLPRYPEHGGQTIGYLDVTIKSIKVTPKTCMWSFRDSPHVVFDKEIPICEGYEYTWNVDMESTPFNADTLHRCLSDDGVYRYMPCCKNSDHMEDEIATHLQQD